MLIGEKQWRIAPRAPRRFFAQHASLHPLVAQLLYNRGLVNPDEIAHFLRRTIPADNPFLLRDMQTAVTLLRRAVTAHLPIAVYGDYDVDGITASAIMVETLRSLGAQVEAYIPTRAGEGYGLNPAAITALAEKGVRVLVTVDCGIRSLPEIALARRLGMQVVITDHHHLGESLPAANAVINPRRPDCRYPFKDLAGAGVAFKLAQALLRTNHQVPLKTTHAELTEASLLDLVALGTVADMVPLLGENHVLVARGLEQINEGRRPGVAALLSASHVSPGQVTEHTIGYSLAPRINAAGRIADPAIALRLLLASDMSQALPLAQQLDDLNKERRELTATIQEQAQAIITRREVLPPLLFAAMREFPSGVVGLAASRLVDEYYRPAVVVAIQGELSKGSARSIPEFHITKALDEVADLLMHHGGHAAAAGFTVRTEHLDTLQSRLHALAHEQLSGLPLSPSLSLDAEVRLSELSWELFKALETLRPFGFGNPAPRFASRSVLVRSHRAVGNAGQHLKLTLEDEQGRAWDAIAFRQGMWIGRLPRRIDVAYVLERNEWRGRVTLQLKVLDIHHPT